ncbi:MAG: hypothetical protein ACKOCN_10075, partial [Planctomycetaceae bacterium]
PLTIPFTVERLYGFAGDVTARSEQPAGTSGIPAATAALPAAPGSGTIMIPLAANATPGTHELKLSFTVVFNGQQLVVPGLVTATVAAAPPPAAQ